MTNNYSSANLSKILLYSITYLISLVYFYYIIYLTKEFFLSLYDEIKVNNNIANNNIPVAR